MSINIGVIDPTDERELLAMDVLERSSFELSGNDPTENPKVIKYIAEHGRIVAFFDRLLLGDLKKVPADLQEIGYGVQAATSETDIKQSISAEIKAECGRIPLAFVELISLNKSMEFFKQNINDMNLVDSPFMISKANDKRIYKFIRNVLGYDDAQIIDHHGIGVHQDYQDQGKGSHLLFRATSREAIGSSAVQCNIDVATLNSEGTLDDVFNDKSFNIHLTKSGFFLADILAPPVYEQQMTYAAVIKIPNPIFESGEIKLDINELRKNPSDLVEALQDMTSRGYVGNYYSTNGMMTFQKLDLSAPKS
ncbi:MAG: hypothetical protein Q8O89_09120 [Nanoarchaeota archaeon]|nr:hypothetical protein [Nanoarchaeota archaeon]